MSMENMFKFKFVVCSRTDELTRPKLANVDCQFLKYFVAKCLNSAFVFQVNLKFFSVNNTAHRGFYLTYRGRGRN